VRSARSVNAANVVAPADPVLVIVTVSVLALVVIVIPVPATSVKVSVLESATTFVCPATAMVVKLSEALPPPAAAMVMVSVPASVVMVMLEPATKVNVSELESATTLLCPATAIVAKLSEALPPVTVAHELSPLKYVLALGVPVAPIRAMGTVPEVSCVAFRAVRLAPLAAGRVAGNLASGMVPLVSCVAFRAVKFTPDAAGSVAGKRASGTVPLVSSVAFRAVINVPTPLKLVAVSNPESDMLAELTCMIVPVTPSYLTMRLST
jgi:hypothetical protein